MQPATRLLDARIVLSVHGILGVRVPGSALAIELLREILDLADPLR